MTLPAFFRGASQAALAELSGGARSHTFREGATLFRAGAEAAGIWLIESGKVRVVRGRHGRPHVVHWEEAGGALGEAAVFGDGRYPATAIAMAPTQCLFLPRGALERAMRLDSAVSLLLLGRLSARVAALVERFDQATGQDIRARLREWLATRSQLADGGGFTLGLTQAQLAEELGTVREVVVRCLRSLVEEGMVERVGRGRFRLTGRADSGQVE
jgi:CRP/FNR family transcriptional regulator